MVGNPKDLFASLAINGITSRKGNQAKITICRGQVEV